MRGLVLPIGLSLIGMVVVFIQEVHPNVASGCKSGKKKKASGRRRGDAVEQVELVREQNAEVGQTVSV